MSIPRTSIPRARLHLSRTSTLVACLLPVALAAIGCDGGSPGGTGGTGGATTTGAAVMALSMSLARGPANEILVTVKARGEAGEAIAGAELQVSVTSGTAGDVSDGGGGEYSFSVQPAGADREVEIRVEAGAVQAKKTAIVLGSVGDAWDQAEAIDGYVNTPGWEDGASVSEDGEWLLVGTYVPMDALSCHLAAADPTAPECNRVIAPYSAPERPGMLGAERILSATEIDHQCPALNFPPPGRSIAVMPAAAYGFHRQPDGSYAEPFVIGFSANGCLGPYGIAFAGPISGKSATAVFAHDDPLTFGAGDTFPDLYFTPLTLGEENILGAYSFDGASVKLSDAVAVQLPLPDLTGTQGNAGFSGGRLWWDDESEQDDRQLFFADVTGELPGATISPTKVAGVSRQDLEDIQPTLDGSTLYWMGEGRVWTSELAAGADPALPGSWGPVDEVLGPSPALDGVVVATGEPTVAHVGGETWLYFVYIQKDADGYDANVARIRKRAE